MSDLPATSPARERWESALAAEREAQTLRAELDAAQREVMPLRAAADRSEESFRALA